VAVAGGWAGWPLGAHQDAKAVNDSRRRVHFVGIGGIGMSGIAEVLLTLGYSVSGSDLTDGDTTRRLAALGARIDVGGHDAARIDADVDVVVISSAVAYANPEVARARELGVPIIPRAEMLAELMRMKFGVAVAGTHGKTTTTSLVGCVLREGGMDPTVVVGGKLRTLGSNARLGQSRYLVAEADESDGSFLLLSPIIAVVTNMDPEHLDHFGDMDAVRSAYLQFVNRVPFYGLAVLCIDSVNVRALLPQARKRVVTYGTSSDAFWQARELAVGAGVTSFEAWRGGELLGTVRLKMQGRHHGLNALASLAVADELGVGWRTAADALEAFEGIHRRFEVRGEEQGITVVDDYAHHPEEIRATLRAAREGYGRRVVAAFQPHRYTRTRDLFDDFLAAFDDADVLLLTDIYAAGETPIDGVSAEHLFQALRKRGHLDVRYVPSRDDLASAVIETLAPGDVVLTLGAGSVHRTADEVLATLRTGVAVPTLKLH